MKEGIGNLRGVTGLGFFQWLREKMADVIVFSFYHLAEVAGIDLGAAVESKVVVNARGSAVKYDKL